MPDSSFDITITDFDDYRDFLSELLEQEKFTNKKKSYAYYAKKLGTSRSYLKLLVQKKRHTSQDKIWKLAKLFKLSDLSCKYLVFMFLRDISKEVEIKFYFKQVLWALRDKIKFKQRMPHYSKFTDTLISQSSSMETNILCRSWLHMAIYSLVLLSDFQKNPKWIVYRLGNKNITEEEVQLVLKELITNKILLEKNQTLIQNEVYYREPSFLDAKEYKDYQPIIHRSIEATEDVDRHRSFCFQGRTLALDLENEKKAIDLYQELFAKLLELEKASLKPESVLLFSNNIFNVTPGKKYL